MKNTGKSISKTFTGNSLNTCACSCPPYFSAFLSKENCFHFGACVNGSIHSWYHCILPSSPIGTVQNLDWFAKKRRGRCHEGYGISPGLQSVCPRSEQEAWSEIVVFSESIIVGRIVLLVPRLLILSGSI